MPRKDAILDQPSVEEKRAARAAKKARIAKEQALVNVFDEQPFLKSEFIRFGAATPRAITVMTWNMLAQALIRRKLFPNSDCLRWNERSLMIGHMLHYEPDLAALQEVDRIDDHAKHLVTAGYDYIYEKGFPKKKHGLALCWKRAKFRQLGEPQTVSFDDELIHGSRTGLSRRTRNIGFAVALQHLDSKENGVILATHHLFWHARHIYERSRQLALWIRHLRHFRQQSKEIANWPVILAGDFNFQPTEISYALLATGGSLSQAFDEREIYRMRLQWEESRVVHESVNLAAADEDDEEPDDDSNQNEPKPATNGDASSSPYANHPDRILHHCRPAVPQDGLIEFEELVQLFRSADTFQSAYDQTYAQISDHRFGGRRSMIIETEGNQTTVLGDNEPVVTNVTALCQSFYALPLCTHNQGHCTLDYIFVSPGHGQELAVNGLLQVPPLDQLAGGLPMAKICASDHLPLMAELSFEAI